MTAAASIRADGSSDGGHVNLAQGLTGTGGAYPITITATNSAGTNMQSFTLTVSAPAAITSANSTTFVVGTNGSFTVTRTGFPTPTLSVSGTLPTGVTFTPGTGALSGTPGAGTGGSYPLVFTASNGVGSDATQNFTLTVNEPAAITSADNTTFTVGTNGSFTITTNGSPSPTITQAAKKPLATRRAKPARRTPARARS